jgi:hypothetical protein
MAGRYENASCGTFIEDSPPQIPDCAHIDDVIVALCLNNILAAMQWIEYATYLFSRSPTRKSE